MSPAEHHEKALALLAKAEDVIDTPRCHLAKSYAAMALVHAELAKTATPAYRPEPIVRPGSIR